ncbi:MAG: hypothetical protein HY681_08680 [Chloroflexi bacterium]|nr:hypothetical protein [Chloroflexota bacterium]
MANVRVQNKKNTHMLALSAALSALLALGALSASADSGKGSDGIEDGAPAAKTERLYEMAGEMDLLGETPECEGLYKADAARAEIKGACEGLEPGASYTIRMNGMDVGSFVADALAGANFSYRTDKGSPVPAVAADSDVLELVDAEGMTIAVGGWEPA